MPRACHDECKGAVGLKAWPVLGISIVQGILCLAHWFIYLTWMHFGWPLSPGALHGLRVALAVLSFSFAFSALLSFRLVHPLVRLIYRIAVLWLGFAHFIFMACVTAWLVDPFLLFVAGPQRSAARHGLAAVLCLAVLAAVAYGLINARIIRVRRIPVTLPNLPAAWRGRTALLLSDLHLGNVNTDRFAARITRIARSLSPDVVLISGDLYDGARDKPAQLAEPLFHINTPLGTFYSTGNHEEFGVTARYVEALKGSPIRVLDDDCVEIDGLRIAGVSYQRSTAPMQLRSFLEGLKLREGGPSVLLNHVPNGLPIVEECGVSLQLSGHTHGGQIFPFTWVARRAFGEFTYGLHSFRALQVYTSTGAGTWGPPMRVGTTPEMALLEFR